jgi:hypothetical protein
MIPKINLRELRLPFFVLAVFCLNILIYVRALLTIEPDNIIFLECVRNSGRTSAGLNLLILLIIGHWGLKTIYNDRYKKKVFLLLFLLFAVNHLIHLFFIVQHFIVQERELLGITYNMRALITFMCIILIPLILIRFRKLNKILYAIILAHIFNVTYLISELFYARYKPFDPAYIHRIGVVIMIGSILYILYRVY